MSNSNQDKIQELLDLFEQIDGIIEDPDKNELDAKNEVKILQRRTSDLIGELDGIITKYGERIRGQAGKKKDIFRHAVTIRDSWGSAILKDVIAELHIIKEKYKKANSSKVKSNAVKQEFFSFNPTIDPIQVFETFSKIIDQYFDSPILSLSINTSDETFNSLTPEEFKSLGVDKQKSISLISLGASETPLYFLITFQFNNNIVGPNGNFILMLGAIELNSRAEKIIRQELPLNGYPEIANFKMKNNSKNPIFKENDFKERKGYCFVMMPFTENWSNRVWKKIRDIIENNSFKCERADNLYGHNVLEDIWKAINEAELLIADVTNKNSNVFYEIGLAHSLGKRVILITQRVDDIPFDFRNYRHLVYEDNVDGFETLQIELLKFIK